MCRKWAHETFQSRDSFIFGQGVGKGPTNIHVFYFEVLRKNLGTIPVVSPLRAEATAGCTRPKASCGPTGPYGACKGPPGAADGAN